MAKSLQSETNVIELKRDKGNVAEDAVKALNLGKLKSAQDAFESANGSYRNVCKHVDEKLHLKAAKDALSIKKSGKIEEKVAYLTALFDYLVILGIPIEKSQLDLFRVEQPRTPAVDRAKVDGRYAGIMGRGMDQNPYSLESEQGQAWMDAWHGGCKERELIIALEPKGHELIAGDDTDGDGGEVFSDEDDDELSEVAAE